MIEVLERAKRLKVTIDADINRLAGLQGLERDLYVDREMFENALRPTFIHDVLLEEIREEIDGEIKNHNV